MKEHVRKHLSIEKDIHDKLAEIEEIIKSNASNSAKLDSIRAILTELAIVVIDTQSKASIDGMTGFLLSGFFESFLEKRIDEAKRYKQKLSLIIIDIDFLKYFNDKYGHLAGTNVIKKIANVINKIIRTSDIVIRYGGDEFVIICPQTDYKGAQNLSDRIKESVNKVKIPEKRKISVSIGISGWNRGDTVKTLFEKADKKLYQAKKKRIHPEKMLSLEKYLGRKNLNL